MSLADKENEIVALEQAVINKHVEETGDAPDGSNPLAMTSTIAATLVDGEVDKAMDLLLALQKMHAEDEGVSV